ncbi:hypothetical protein B0H63DRAFT_445038 [Podospora didyma]|uniref:Uncharacterized protein n=1 Tax=Podospora didyma TaxID=330526 RepID=A0AAE0P7X0_9PEZI|nr:hypothetical protein B0H63DRAFT_445038 [Podospora didyma]
MATPVPTARSVHWADELEQDLSKSEARRLISNASSLRWKQGLDGHIIITVGGRVQSPMQYETGWQGSEGGQVTEAALLQDALNQAEVLRYVSAPDGRIWVNGPDVIDPSASQEAGHAGHLSIFPLFVKMNSLDMGELRQLLDNRADIDGRARAINGHIKEALIDIACEFGIEEFVNMRRRFAPQSAAAPRAITPAVEEEDAPPAVSQAKSWISSFNISQLVQFIRNNILLPDLNVPSDPDTSDAEREESADDENAGNEEPAEEQHTAEAETTSQDESPHSTNPNLDKVISHIKGLNTILTNKEMSGDTSHLTNNWKLEYFTEHHLREHLRAITQFLLEFNHRFATTSTSDDDFTSAYNRAFVFDNQVPVTHLRELVFAILSIKNLAGNERRQMTAVQDRLRVAESLFEQFATVVAGAADDEEAVRQEWVAFMERERRLENVPMPTWDQVLENLCPEEAAAMRAAAMAAATA